MNAKLLSRALVLVSALALARPVAAQMPGQPVIQNAFTNPGWAFGVNYGDSDAALGYGAAVAWGNATAKFGLSAGGGLWDPSQGENVFAWGARAMWSPLRFAGAQGGAAVFAGIGGARQDLVDVVEVPIGVAAGFRTSLGGNRGLSVYAAPFVRVSRADLGGGDAETSSLFRASIGVDAAVLPKVGVTVGYEFGSTADAGKPGPSGGIFGIGVSYVLR